MIAVRANLRTDIQFKVFERGQIRETTLAELLTRRTILSVYMRNNTPSCDRQNDALVRFAAEADRAGYNLIAVSRDTCGSHARYAAAKRVSYPLISDPDDLLANAADAVVEKTMYGRKFRGPARTAFVLDRDGTVLAIIDKVDALEHDDQLRAVIARLNG